VKKALGVIIAGAAAAIGVTVVAACTLIVDSEFKGYSGTCQIPHAGDNVCGQCATQNCQDQINASCADKGNSLADSLASCFSDPSPGTYNSGCFTFLDDASVTAHGQAQSQFDLRGCMSGKCYAACTKCTEVQYGPTACGACIQMYCGAMLDGVNGCCGSDGVQSGIKECIDPVNGSCTSFEATVRDIRTDSGFGGCEDAGYCQQCNFAQCVYDNCVNGMFAHPCQ
jgi:hypothetical protein